MPVNKSSIGIRIGGGIFRQGPSLCVACTSSAGCTDWPQEVGACGYCSLPGEIQKFSDKWIPKRFFCQVFLLEAWGAKAEKPHISLKIMVFGPCRRRRQGQQTTLFLNMCGLLALVPQASPKTLSQQKHFRIPLHASKHR